MAVLQIFRYAQPVSAMIVVGALAWLTACAPVSALKGAGVTATHSASARQLPPDTAGSPAAATGDPLPFAGRQGAGPDRSQLTAGVQSILVGCNAGYHVTLKMIPPAQVCDTRAFVDGVRAGYVTTWNGLVAASGGAADGSAARRPLFDPAPVPVRLLDERYRLQWSGGSEPANACAAYGYQIGKVMGTRQAYVDARGAS